MVGANVGTSLPLPQDGVIQITFDRFLNPAWVNRQSVALRDEFGGAPDSPVIQYDPVTRVVTLSNPNPGQPWLLVGQPYQVLFPIPQDAGDFGLRAIDGATLDPATQTIGFMIAPPTGAPPTPPKIDFCSDVMPIFRVPAVSASGNAIQGRCGSAICHGVGPAGGATTEMGLVLDTEDGIRHTAIGVVASETNGTGLAGQPLPPQDVFPVGMPIIDPGNPGDSYLLYKLLRADVTDSAEDAGALAYTACKPTTAPFDYGPGASFASADERTRLANHTMGRRMPWGEPSLTLDEIERLRLWIAQGAEVDDCSACPATSP